MKQAFKQTLAACALGAGLVRPGPGIGRRGQDRRAGRPVRHDGRPVRQVRRRGREDGGRGFRRHRAGQADRGDLGRPPEQGGHRRGHGPPVVRERQGRPDPGRAQLRHRAGGAGPDAADEARGDLHQRRLGRPDRQGLLAQWHALDLRHLCLRHRRGQRRHGRRRQELVLHHVRLRLRPLAGTRRDGGGQEQGRPGAGQRAPSHRQCRLLVLPVAGAGVQGPGDRPGQRQRRHHQQHQAGVRVRHHGRQAARGRAVHEHRRRAQRGAGIRAGAEPGRAVLGT